MGRGGIGEEEERTTDVASVITWHCSEHADPLSSRPNFLNWNLQTQKTGLSESSLSSIRFGSHCDGLTDWKGRSARPGLLGQTG